MRTCGALLVVSCLAMATAARGQTVPGGMFVSGVARDENGILRDGPTPMRFRLYDGRTSLTVLHEEQQAAVPVSSGVFTTRIAQGIDLTALLLASNEVWFTAAMAGDSLEQPRVQVGAAPYALVAQEALHARSAAETAHAASADNASALAGVSLTSLERRLPAPVPPLSLDAVTRLLSIEPCTLDGAVLRWDTTLLAWLCDTVPTYAAGFGLTLMDGGFSVDTDAIQARVSGSCPPGAAVRAIAADGGVTCELDDDTLRGVGAGSGLILDAGVLHTDPAVLQRRVSGTCAAGTFVTGIDPAGSVTCAAPTPPVVPVVRVVRTNDPRTGCPAPAAANETLFSQTFTLARAGQIRTRADIIRFATGRVDLALVVDGTPQDNTLTYTPTAQWADAHAAWSGSLAAGDHTISVRSATPNVWGCGAGWGSIDTLIIE